MDTVDEGLVARLPIRLSGRLGNNVHVHQYPLLPRPLQAPPSADNNGRSITARIKPRAGRLEVHVPVEISPDVWNSSKARDYGTARQDDDRERNQFDGNQTTSNLEEVRLKSEAIAQTGVQVLGIVRDGELHLHAVTSVHQFRPTLTYLDVLSRKTRKARPGAGSDSDSDEGPPPDPDEPPPPTTLKREKKGSGDAKEVQVSARKTEDKSSLQILGGMSAARREMLQAIRAEDDEQWLPLRFHQASVTLESEQAYENLFSQQAEVLGCNTDMTAFLS